MNILIAAGGTGGHIYPGLSIGEKLKERYPDAHILFVGSHVGMEKNIIPKTGFPLELIRSRGFERGFSKETLEAVIGLIQSSFDAKALLKKYKPDLVISTGGFTGATLLREAQKMNIPTMIHEQNAFPGRSNRLNGKKAYKIGVGFAEAEKYFPDGKTFTCGNPVRRSFFEQDREANRKAFGLKPGDILITVMGGSQGARSINEAAAGLIANLSGQTASGGKVYYKVLTGRGNKDVFEAELIEKIGRVPEHVEMIEYMSEMDKLLSASDLAIARSGAASVAEFCSVGLPSILIPYPYAAGDHQTFNARSLSDHGAAVIIPDQELTDTRLLTMVKTLLEDPNKLENMRRDAYALSIEDSADQFVDQAVAFIGE